MPIGPVADHHWLHAIYGNLLNSYNCSTYVFVATAHFAHARMRSNTNLFGVNGTVHSCCPYVWFAVPWRGIMQFTASIVIWTHACINLHAWVRAYPSYAKVKNTALAFAILLPTLAFAGYVAARNRILGLAQQEGWVASRFAKKGSALDDGANLCP